MATYNRAHFIVEALLSIQEQTFVDWECLIINDGGTDSTAEVIASILENDKRFQFLDRPVGYLKGLPGCRNYGLNLAKGGYIIFFDDDDCVHPDNLQLSLAVIQKENTDFCHYQKQSFESSVPDFQFEKPKINQILNQSHLYEILTNQIGLASCTVLWNKRCFENIRFNEYLLYAEEWECYSRIIAKGHEGVVIENVLYFNRKHLNSNTGEFYTNNAIRKKSKKDAILLVIKNLRNNGLLSDKIIRYFVQTALLYKEYQLFPMILKEAQLSGMQKLKWRILYALLPVRLYLYNIKKKMAT